MITEWLLDKPGIRLLPSIPYEHDTVRTVERANQTMDNTINKMLDLPRNKHLTRQHWAMAFMHALKIKNRLPTTALHGRSPISLWQPEVFDPRRFPLQPYGTIVAAHIPLDTRMVVCCSISIRQQGGGGVTHSPIACALVTVGVQ